MITSKPTLKALHSIAYFLLFIFTVTSTNAQTTLEGGSSANTSDVGEEVIYWDIKATRMQTKSLHIKAIDSKGKHHDVKAIQDSEDISILSVKAFVNGKILPIKMIVKTDDRYYPVKSIDEDGRILDIKAIGEGGKLLPVKGVSKTGNVVHIRAIDEQHRFYNVVAISPDEKINHVKGIKMMDQEVETIIRGIKVFAHVKSMKEY